MKQTWTHKSCVPLKNGTNHVVVPIEHNMLYSVLTTIQKYLNDNLNTLFSFCPAYIKTIKDDTKAIYACLKYVTSKND